MNWRLIFSGFRSPGWIAYAVLATVAAMAISFWLMRLERKLVSRPVGWTLLGLRLLVLLTLLVTMFQPVLTKRFDVSQRGRVVVAIDGSLSMETQDRHASVAEKLRWAQALGMLGNSDTAPLIEQWVKSAEAGQPINWLGTDAPATTPADQATADAREKQITESLNEIAAMPRVEFVRRLLQSQPHMLLDKFKDVMPIDLRLFATEQESVSAKELGTELQSARTKLIPGSTDALQMLQTLTAEEDGGQVRAVVLISDGRQTVPGDVAGSALRMAGQQVPIYTIPIGSNLPPRDLSIAAVDSPEAIFLNDKAQIRAVLGTSGFEGSPVTVRLEKDGITVDQQTITPASDAATVIFSVPSDKAGRFDYRLAADGQPGELRDDNNLRDVSFRVVDNKARVMVVEGDPRWEFRYLRNLLERDKQVDPQTVLFQQPYLNLLNQSYIASKLPPIEAFREQLARTDILIVGDVTPAQVDAGVWELVEKAVAQDGLTLVVVAGRRAMPHGFQSPILSAMLPVSDFRQRLAEQFQTSRPDADPTTFQLTLTPEAQSMPMFQLSADPSKKNTTLASLPGHPWIYGGKPKPGASVWANASIAGFDLPPEPAIIHQDYGFGQVLWMGIDSTWRWRMRAGDEWHYKFWGQLIRWAARNKSAAGNDNVRMTLSDVIIDESETVEAVVRWNPKLLTQLEGASVEAVATRIDAAGNASQPDEAADEGKSGGAQLPDGKSPSGQPGAKSTKSPGIAPVSVRLNAGADAPERFTGRLPRLGPGAWRIQLQVSGGSVKLDTPVQTELLVRAQLSAELANVSCNRELLRQLSELSGGQLIEPYDAERLVSLIQPKDEVEQKIQERTLWDHWLVLLIFFVLLMSEWVLRKLHGLP